MTARSKCTSPRCSDEALNSELIAFLADVLGTPKSRLEIVAGITGRDKIVSVLDMDVDTVNQRVIAHLD